MFNRFLSSVLATCVGMAAVGMTQAVSAKKPKINPATLTVIGYHEVTDDKEALIPMYSVSTARFEEQVRWLQKSGFHFISVDQLLKAHQGKTVLPEKPVLLTVDDGYENFYTNVYPFVKANKIPIVLAVVGSWLEPKADEMVNFGDDKIPRSKIVTWPQLKEMSKSGYVEIASHSYDLHHGILGNPQGNSEPAATTRLYDPETKTYEGDGAYSKRIYDDLKKNNDLIKAHGIPSPRVMVWPYGRYNLETVRIAKELGMPITVSLDDGPVYLKKSLGAINRILVEHDMTLDSLSKEISIRDKNLGDNYRPQKIMHVDLDYIYDPDPEQQERNLGDLLDRIQKMHITTVYLQAFSDPDANGSADMVYFPNRYLPVRADLFNRVSWQIQSRTQVTRLYAWMPLLAWELPKSNPVSQDLVVTQQPKSSDHLNMGYIRLSPFSAPARRVIEGLYQDLAKSSTFNGILFHDDTTLSDYEDASPYALKAYAKAGLPTDLEKMRNNDAEMEKWTKFKTNYIDNFALQLAGEVRQYQPFLVTARNLYAQVALNPYAENWYAQSLEQSLKRYDFTAIMAMPYMEQAPDKDKFYQDIVNRVKSYPNGLHKTVFELQAENWRTNEPVPSEELGDTIQSLYKQGALHIAYYPDDPVKQHPDVDIMRKAFDSKPDRIVP
ncbi:poly-beta-1,6-N-acetyl-D-glucosamine N-deacetylase PgaB [Acinetobacter brisouii CIP 110357]|uniref:Poly-beta-1,6-N-acetyl-D-glucosamine N-deacetylase PgaB n=1 Tax=Acinetobacter brisouii CIP 110357 TaxID=1341683 RepID=V2VUC6_9GAMM|nr:poly-beta-1,6-N-acetyl-D-glucosamine N-deacetylase PgaB [Acinetobacter brisouii]ENV47702.1 poly-beta-1,6-N-acetyl-D-glucosamine N-deacetylase PgaB [Acinetobacter brisouii ANC 4119]ESK51324.1 poly-beta-1,6-N-acetyl-D-glucosamine N-deacetylase PgaB [Acinetobacter brisouii CIP 110357]